MEAKKYYIAYGSNLSRQQMAQRCPGAKIVGGAVLKGWQLLFGYYATVEPAEGKSTPVLVWEITSAQEQQLDEYEDYPKLYRKAELAVECTPLDEGTPQPLTAMVYRMEPRPREFPSFSYYQGLEDAYKDLGFPLHTLEQALADSMGRAEASAWLAEYRLNYPHPAWTD